MAPPTMTAIPKPTPRMRSRCPFDRAEARGVVRAIRARDYSPLSALKLNDSGPLVSQPEIIQIGIERFKDEPFQENQG